jgi:hypothetical protein
LSFEFIALQQEVRLTDNPIFEKVGTGSGFWKNNQKTRFKSCVLRRCHSAWLVKSLATIGCCAALVSLVLLAEIRGDLLTEEIKVASTEMTVDSAGTAHPEDFTFYDRTLALLRVAMGSLAIAVIAVLRRAGYC